MRWRWLTSYLADLLYPVTCAACDASAESPPLCETCLSDLREIETSECCDRCAYPLTIGMIHCPRCHGHGIAPLERIVCLGVFHDPLKELVHRIKYRNGWPLAEYLADRIVQHEPAKALLTETDLLVAIPLHPLRQMERGYNQAEVIAERVGNRCGIPRLRPMIRLRNTETQTHLHSHEKRVENLRGAFGLVDEREIQGRHVVLVDDVMTSGATLTSAARVLQQASPASISALTLCVSDPKGRAFEAI